MESKIQKWGNSNGVRIPKNILEDLKLKADDIVEIKREKEAIIITKKKQKFTSLQERIDAYEGPNMAKDFVWDERKGKEIW